MSSEESDDEPLSILAANKKLNPDNIPDIILPSEIVLEPKKKRRKFMPLKNTPLSINIQKKLANVLAPPVIERPSDVWLYLKDLNPNGPYSCLLCPDWFINRSKIIVHYVLNHKKDFCGICRYFVPDRKAWWAHVQFHTPWPCSQCVENFVSENALRAHLSTVHNLVHCRLCHFRISDDDQYNAHLYQKHNVSNVSSKDFEVIWEIEDESKFSCLLCSKSSNMTRLFFNHYMGFHHFTLKCLTRIISGTDPPFLVYGAEVSSEFVETQLKIRNKHGYLDLEKSSLESIEPALTTPMEIEITTEIKDEIVSDSEGMQCNDNVAIETDNLKGDDNKINNDVAIETDNAKGNNKTNNDEMIKTYKGDVDFDVTLVEIVMFHRGYLEYVNTILEDINLSLMPKISYVDYEKFPIDITSDIYCSLCKTKHSTTNEYSLHMTKMHAVKCQSSFSCRVCYLSFDSQAELESHISQELSEFDDLWLCQFCDREFINREMSRTHLTEHWDLIEYDNCFSPHLGFKCKYCPTLFWNELDRETHQVKIHFKKYKEEYYKCDTCDELYSDKMWFIHHHVTKHQNTEDIPLYLLKCCLCFFVHSNVEEMRSHFQTIHPEAKKVYCSLDPCKYKPLSQRKSFMTHLKTIHKRTPKPTPQVIKCRVCSREFASVRAISAHIGKVHGPGKFKCKLCKEALQTADERKLHYLIDHPGQHPFACNVCGKSFQYKSSLYMHKQDHAPNKQNYTCSYCKKVFAKKDSFREHVQIHEGPRHACSYCPMRFVQRSNMLRHERRHTGERPYACSQCPRTFADKGACNSHTRTHSKDASYACMYCGQTFVQKSKLTYHIRKHTGENLETCSVCSKLFTSACSLREHMKVHDVNKKTVKCPLCERKYQDERYMLRHLRTSHAQTQFSCPLCPKTLTSPAGLRHHVLTHSGMKTYRCKICPKAYSVKRTIVKHLRRRHGVKITEINVKDFYTRLEPRDCNLNLDEKTMNSIFGTPKKVLNKVTLVDFVTAKQEASLIEASEEPESSRKNEKISEASDKSSDCDKDSERDETDGTLIPMNLIKKEQDGNCYPYELEPTDFVSVKIEPIDEQRY